MREEGLFCWSLDKNYRRTVRFLGLFFVITILMHGITWYLFVVCSRKIKILPCKSRLLFERAMLSKESNRMSQKAFLFIKMAKKNTQKTITTKNKTKKKTRTKVHLLTLE